MQLQAVLAAALTVAAAGSAQAASVEITDAVARVTVIPEDRRDIKVDIVSHGARTPLQVRKLGDRTIIDGDLDRRIMNCRGRGEGVTVHVRGVGDVSWREMPHVVIRTPRHARIEAGGAVFGAVSRAQSLELDTSGCGDWTLANVAGDLRLRTRGSGDTRAGTAGSANIQISGSGDVALADVRGGLAVDIRGSGGVIARSINGPLGVELKGSGDVDVMGGRATAMSVSVMGSGDVDFRGAADSLSATIAGSGDVRAKEVKGAVSKRVMGSGNVRIG